MANQLVWNSPQIPESDLDPWEVLGKVQALTLEDEPSSSDVGSLVPRYNTSSPEERDAIDAALVWLTGYTFSSICAMVATPDGKDFERTLEKWRKARS
jgi:hypothetical protein